MTRSLVVQGDARRLPLPDNSVHAIVCDPPYGIRFMGSEWDAFPIRDRGPSLTGSGNPTTARGFGGNVAYGQSRAEAAAFQAWCEEWATEALRVLKPGGYLLAFGSPRTWHRLVCGVEDAGFEIRDQEMRLWSYASGFPKSVDVGRAVDMELCTLPGRHCARTLPPEDRRGPDDHVCPDTPEGTAWDGFGSATKPSWEPVMCARRPLAGTLAGNVLAYGVGGLNIDGTRVNPGEAVPGGGNGSANVGGIMGPKTGERPRVEPHTAGRWPSNLLLQHSPGCQPTGTRKVRGSNGVRGRNALGLINDDGWQPSGEGQPIGYADPDGNETVTTWSCQDDCPVRLLDEQSGERKDGGNLRGSEPSRPFTNVYGDMDGRRVWDGYADRGGASRFFPQFAADAGVRFRYTAKAPRAERVTVDGDSHATVKPLDLMRWLVRLVTPPGGLVLDCFAGSGTTGEAAMLEGMRSVLVDLDMDSCRKAMVRTDPHVRRRGAIVTDEAGRLVEEGEADAPRLFA